MDGGPIPCLKVISAIAFLVKITEEMVMRSSLTIFVTQGIVALLNSQHTQQLLRSHVTSYEILLLTAPQITLIYCNILNPAPFLISSVDEIPMTV